MIQVFKNIKMKVFYYLIVNMLSVLLLVSCENVEDGYDINYAASSASFNVELTTSDRGSDGDIAIFTINASSDFEIKSIVVNSTASGGEATGYVVDTATGDDPLVDHIFGTIQPGTTAFSLQYYYEFPSDTTDNTITFTLIDGEGKAEVSFDLEAIPDVKAFNTIELASKSSTALDGFSTSDGTIYENLDDYSEVTTANLYVQESIDLAFVVSNAQAKLICPYNDNYFGVDFSNTNKTLFKRLEGVSSADFDSLTNITLSEITENYKVKSGASVIDSLTVGDVIGFRTDYASSNPYKYGILRVNAIHPTNVDRYDGTSYLLEIDVLVQQ